MNIFITFFWCAAFGYPCFHPFFNVIVKIAHIKSVNGARFWATGLLVWFLCLNHKTMTTWLPTECYYCYNSGILQIFKNDQGIQSAITPIVIILFLETYNDEVPHCHCRSFDCNHLYFWIKCCTSKKQLNETFLFFSKWNCYYTLQQWNCLHYQTFIKLFKNQKQIVTFRN